MVKPSRALLLFVPVGLALLCATPAHAGMLGWMDDAFTFRTEQKPLVAPKRNIPPKLVVQPYYPNDEHVAWSNFYTRTDLEPQDYLSSSASKVMRPTAQEQAAGSPAQGQGGWPAIAERAAANAQAEAENSSPPGGNVMIGDPGQGWGMQSGDANVGRATRIGPAVQDWQGNGDTQVSSRPGDYDYRAPVGEQAAVAQADSNIAIGTPNPTANNTGGGGITTFDTTGTDTSNDPRYVAHNAKGQVTKYAVQGGDTLSSISGQPAIYNTWKLWPLIYSANKRAIGGNPANIKQDERLDIPRDYTQKQMDAAERKATQ